MQPRSAESVFRRFFRLIERLEAAQEPQGGAAPETKARITRLDNAPHRPG
ncbi:MAG: hypothetical protein LCH38_07240 [Proteobacteria bacterium]|nr:hypothetical protein [Pseudomonadota bacterium]